MSYAKLCAVLVVAVVMTAGVGCIFSGFDDGEQSAQPTLAQQIEQTDVQNDVSVPSLTLGSPILLQQNSVQTWTSGACTCTLDTDTGVFTVSGSGAMQDYQMNGSPWYNQYRTEIEYVVLSSGVTHVGNHSFHNCIYLKSVDFGQVTSIGDGAFRGCSVLFIRDTMTIPNSVTSLGADAFIDCSGFEYVILPNQITTLGNNVFNGCAKLQSITIPNTVTSIGVNAFIGCTALASVTIGSGVTSIGNRAFAECTSLQSVTIPDSVTSLGTYVFSGCSSLISVTFGTGITSIGEYAFLEDNQIVTFIFTSSTWSITSIGRSAFSLSSNPSVFVNSTVLSPNNVQNGRLDPYSYDYTTYSYLATPTPISVDATVLYGQHYEYTVTTSITASITISGPQTSWLTLNGNVVSGTVPRQVSSDTSLEVIAISTQPQQATIQEVNFTFVTSKTFQIGDSLYQDVSMADPTQPYSVDVRGTGTSYSYTPTTAPLKDLGTDLTSITISGTPTVFNPCVFYHAGFTSVIFPNSITSLGQGSFAGSTIKTIVMGNGFTQIPSTAFSDVPPQGSMTFRDSSGNALNDIAQVRGHVYTLNFPSQYMADALITVNSYNDATCYAVVGKTLQNSQADRLGFSATLTAYSGTQIDAQVQTAWNSATHTFTVNPAVGTSVVDSNGYLSGTAPQTTGTYDSTAYVTTVIGGATISGSVAFHVYVEQVLVITSTPS